MRLDPVGQGLAGLAEVGLLLGVRGLHGQHLLGVTAFIVVVVLLLLPSADLAKSNITNKFQT